MDSYTSNYLYAASCLVEAVWEHFQTKKNFSACFRTKTQIQNLYQSSIQFCQKNDFLCYICLCNKITAQSEEPRYPDETGFFITQTTWSFSIQVHWKMTEHKHSL